MSKVKEFYSDNTVFVTGGTGFLGAILVEKLVRSCPGLNKIFLLIRERNGSSPQDRLKELLKQPVFQKIDNTLKTKIVLVGGNLYDEGLGLSKEDHQTLLNNVSVVIHIAANINFSSPLVKSIEANVLGTRRALQLAKSIPHIKSFVYVSTAYCNCIRQDKIKEIVYPCKWTPDEILKTKYIQSLDEPKVLKRILGNHPNTYTFTKLMAENVVKDERGNLPVSIVRPSIVLGTMKEPIPGWVDNVYNGQFAFIAGASVGVFRTLLANPDYVADMVPSDSLASLVIASAYNVYTNRSLEVYHFTSGSKNPITWGQFCDMTMKGIGKYPLLKEITYPKAKCRSSLLRNHLQVYISHYIPSFIFDLIAPLINEKSIQLAIQKKYGKGMEHSKYFTLNQFNFNTTNTETFFKSLSQDDKTEFDFDVSSIDWRNYIEKCVLGVRLYYHKEDLKTLQDARQSHQA